MDWWQQLTVAAWELLDRHGQLGVFLFLLVEEAGTPIPIPGDFLMALLGAQAAQGRINLLEILAVMELATVLGASCLYWVSARAGRRVVYRLGRHVGLTPTRLDRMAEELNRRGAMAVVLGRMTPGLRIVTPIACGVFRFPFPIFLPAMALGAFVYILAYTLLGYFFGPRVLRILERVELPIALLASCGLLAALAYWTLRVARSARPTEYCPALTERLWAGIATGLIAALVSALLANLLIHLLGLLAFQAPGLALSRLGRMLSADVGREPGLTAASLLIPAVLLVGAGLGALYGAALGKLPHRVGPLHGAAFSLLPLATTLLVILPALGAGPGGIGLGAGLVPAAGETIRHVAYGLVLGTLYRAMARPRRNLPLGSRPDEVPERGGPAVASGSSISGAQRVGSVDWNGPGSAAEAGEP